MSRVAIFDWEMGTSEARRRLRILDAGAGILCKSFPSRGLDDPKFWKELAKLKVGFLIFDSLSAGSGGDISETDARFAEPLRHAARYIEAQRQGAIDEGDDGAGIGALFLHHAGKNAKMSDVEGLFRGTGALRGAVDSAFYFSRVAAPDGEERARVTSIKSRKGAKPPPFTIRMTDARGVEVVDERKGRKPAENDDERIVDAIEQAPSGISSTALAASLEMRKATVLVAVKRLSAAGRLRVEGKGRSALLVAVEPTAESVPA